jgi:predicted nucleic acid-binding protein
MPFRYVLDSNILISLLRYEQKVIERTEQAVLAESEFLLCPVVFYEVYRGLFHKKAHGQLSLFNKYLKTFTWEDLDRDDWQRAALLWAGLSRQGRQVTDADLLIGAFAFQRGAIVVSDNEKHFTGLGVTVENWRR